MPTTPTRDAASAPALRAVGLTKRYGQVLAVEALDLRVERGEIYGFLGRNGAGKTTTIRLLLGMVRPTAGHAEIFGTRVGPRSRDVWRRVGYLVESATAYPELTVRENLEVARLLHGASPRGLVDDALDRLGLGPFADRRARALSTGNLQRLAVARALLHRPELLVLDEPVNGLDPAGVVEVRTLLRQLARERGTTVFISSHLLTEIERVATRVGIIHRGRLVAELSATELEAARRRRLEVGFAGPAAKEAAVAALRRHGHAPGRTSAPWGLVLDDEDALTRPERIARLLVEADAPPTRLVVVQEDMEAFFMAVTGTDDQGAGAGLGTGPGAAAPGAVPQGRGPYPRNISREQSKDERISDD